MKEVHDFRGFFYSLLDINTQIKINQPDSIVSFEPGFSDWIKKNYAEPKIFYETRVALKETA